MIKFIFSNKDRTASKLIRWGTKHEWQDISDCPSHLSFLFFDTFIVESTLKSGVRINYYPSFKKENKIVACFKHRVPPANEDQVFKRMLDRHHGSEYDDMAILYFAWRVLLKKIFKIPLPEKNKWQNAEEWFCNEMFNFITGKDHSMESPNTLMDEMLKSEFFEAIDD